MKRIHQRIEPDETAEIVDAEMLQRFPSYNSVYLVYYFFPLGLSSLAILLALDIRFSFPISTA